MSKQKNENEVIIGTIPEVFMARRTVILSGEINRQSINDVGQRLISLQAHSTDPINLIIDSTGGSMNDALRLCDLMSIVMTAPVCGIAIGFCGSAATFIMLHCSERISTPYSKFLIHSGTKSNISIPIGQTTSENIEQVLKDVRASEEMVLNLYMRKLTPTAWVDGKPDDEEQRKYVQGLINRGDQNYDDWMSAGEAIEVGLITKITHDKLDIFKS